MSDSVTTCIEVDVSPDVAFDVFTREINAWYQVDQETLPDITRTAAIRFEPHVGGRLLDVHDLDTGEGRELGRVSVWEPGHRLVFADNEGCEIKVRFDAYGSGTRVTLAHSGLDRLAPKRAAMLRRSGWGAFAPFYRDHLAPNARPMALALGTWALLLLTGVGVWLTITLAPGQTAAWILAGVIALAAFVVVAGASDRLALRWLPSQWQYRRIQNHLLGLAALGLLLWGLYRAVERGADPVGSTGVSVLLLLSYWLTAQQGPARGPAVRRRARSTRHTFAQRHPGIWMFSLLGGTIALSVGLSLGLPLISTQLAGLFFPAALGVAAAFSLCAIISKRRARRTLGFNPDYYLAVERRMSEQDRRPELLVYEPTKQPEYSGWYAYAREQDLGSRDLVAWSIQDLVDQAPEAARPLREGRGRWRWDQARRAYRPIDPSGRSQPA